MREIRSQAAVVLPVLKASNYAFMESLTFARRGLFGKEHQDVRAGWRIGQFFMAESHGGPDRYEPLHLLADGSFAAFGHLRPEIKDFDDQWDTWWKRRAPESILSGLKELQSRLESEIWKD